MRIVCWGVGKQAEKSVVQLKEKGMLIDCFCDKDSRKWGNNQGGVFNHKPDGIKRAHTEG